MFTLRCEAVDVPSPDLSPAAWLDHRPALSQWCKGSESQKGEDFPSDFEGFGRNEDQLAHLTAVKL